MLVLALAALMLAPFQGQAPPAYPSAPVTYETRAKLLPKVLDEVSKKSGVALRCSPQMENDVVAMEVHGRPLSELMPELAYAVTGKWELRKEGWLLIRDAARAQEEEKAELKERAAAIREKLAPFFYGLDRALTKADSLKTLQAINTERDKLGRRWSNEGMEALKSVEARDPGGRLIGRLLAEIDPVVLASIRHDDRVVFSLTPTHCQRPFGKGAPRAVQLFLQEQTQWAEARDEFAAPPLERNVSKVAPIHDQRPLQERPEEVLVVVQPATFGNWLELWLVLANGRGDVLFRYTAQINVQFESGTDALEVPKGTPWSEQSKILLRNLKETSEGGYWKVSRDWQTKLAKPSQLEPLSLLVTDIVAAIGRRSAKNWIAVPRDFDWGLALIEGWQSPERTVDPEYWGSFLRQHGEGAGSWAVIRPRLPVLARRDRVDRKALEPLLGSVLANGSLRLDPYAEYLSKGPRADSSDLDEDLLRLIRPDLPSGESSRSAMRFYGSLTLSQKQTLLSGHSLSLAEVSPAQKRLAERMVFGAWPQVLALQQETGDRTPDGRPIRAYRGLGSTILLEPTEAFPLGVLPVSAVVSMTVSQADLLCGYSGKKGVMHRDDEPSKLGHMQAQYEAQQGGIYPEETGPLEFYRLGKKWDLTLTLRVSLTFAVRGRMQDREVDYSKPMVRFAELPQAIQDAYKKGFAEGRKIIEESPPPKTSKPPPARTR